MLHPGSDTDKLPYKWNSKFKTFFGLNLMIHKRSQTYKIVYVLGIVFMISYIGTRRTPSSSNENRTPSVYRYDTSNILLANQLKILNSSVAYSPRTDFAERLTLNLPSVSFADFKSLSDEIINHPTNLGISLDAYNETTLNIEMTAIADTRYFGPLTVLSDFFFPALENVTHITSENISTSYFPGNKNNDDKTMGKIMISYLVLPLCLVITQAMIFNVDHSTSKLQFLLRINGLTESTMWGTYLLVYIVEFFPFILISGALFCMMGYAEDTSYGLFILISTIHTISSVLIMLACSTLVRGKAGTSFFSVIDLLFLSGAIAIGYFLEQIPSSIINLAAIFLPHSALIDAMDHCINIKDKVGPLSISLMNYKDVFSFSWILLLQFIQMVISIIVFLAAIFFNARAHGLPIIGWKNMFNSKKWKKAFGSRKVGEYLNSSKSISIEGITKVYNGKVKTVALNNISLNIEEGEIIAMVGPNGSGKSTLISSLTGEGSFDSGTITAYGDSLSNGYNEMYKNLGIVFQEDILIGSLTAAEMITLFGRMNNMSEIEVKAEIEMLSSLLKISDCLNTPSDKLSGGQKRKMCLAIALIRRPSLLILDEPTAGVDATSRKNIWKTLSSFDNMTILVTTHALEEAESVCSRILVMRAGSIAYEGTPAALRTQFQCGYILTDANETANIEILLKIVQEIAPEAKANPDNRHSLIIPADLRATDALLAIEAKKKEIGLDRYTLHVENLEETLVKIVMNDEVKVNE